jgi:hypothetical protein
MARVKEMYRDLGDEYGTIFDICLELPEEETHFRETDIL